MSGFNVFLFLLKIYFLGTNLHIDCFALDSGMDGSLNIVIIADLSDSSVIEEVFYQSLSGKVVVSKYPEKKSINVPILPVGYNSAMTAVQSKIKQARLLPDYQNNAVIVCTTTFMSEVYPQR